MFAASGRLDHEVAGKVRSFEAYGFTSASRFVYRSVDSFGSPRLFSMRSDAVVSPGVPDRFLISNDPNTQLSFILD